MKARALATSLAFVVGISNCGGSGPGGAPTTPAAPDAGPAAPAPPVPGPASPSAHRYFNRLAGRADVLATYSLRDQAMLDSYGHGPGIASPDITYDYQRDPDPRRQDAAKVVVPADKVHIPNQVRLPIPTVSGGSLLITWDAWWGKEFRFANTDIGTYKSFNVASPADNTRMDHRTRFDRAQGTSAVGMVDVRYSADGDPWGPNMQDNLPIAPQAAQFAVQPETWTRYWVYFNPVGKFQEYSLWVADEQTGPILLIDRVQLMPSSRSARGEWEMFWLEYDTSSKSIPAARGPLVGYVRNVVMLRNVSDVMSLLERPEK